MTKIMSKGNRTMQNMKWDGLIGGYRGWVMVGK